MQHIRCTEKKLTRDSALTLDITLLKKRVNFRKGGSLINDFSTLKQFIQKKKMGFNLAVRLVAAVINNERAIYVLGRHKTFNKCK